MLITGACTITSPPIIPRHADRPAGNGTVSCWLMAGAATVRHVPPGHITCTEATLDPRVEELMAQPREVGDVLGVVVVVCRDDVAAVAGQEGV